MSKKRSPLEELMMTQDEAIALGARIRAQREQLGRSLRPPSPAAPPLALVEHLVAALEGVEDWVRIAAKQNPDVTILPFTTMGVLQSALTAYRAWKERAGR